MKRWQLDWALPLMVKAKANTHSHAHCVAHKMSIETNCSFIHSFIRLLSFGKSYFSFFLVLHLILRSPLSSVSIICFLCAHFLGKSPQSLAMTSWCNHQVSIVGWRAVEKMSSSIITAVSTAAINESPFSLVVVHSNFIYLPFVFSVSFPVMASLATH